MYKLSGLLDYEISEMTNGLKIITIKKKTSLIAVNVGIRLGAMDEKADEKGICHFIEHMIFKGTANRSNEQINQALEDRGGYYNAYTDYSSTVYSITALAEELQPSIDLIADILMNSVFSEEELERERKVIQAEIKSHYDDVEEYSYRKANEAAFSRSPLKHDVLGTEKIIKNISVDKIKSFYLENYIPNNCIMSIVSPYDHEEIVSLVKKYMNHWVSGQKKARLIINESNKDIYKTTHKNNIEQATIIFLYTFHHLSRREEIALEILNHKLGSSANSILFRILREENGIAYDVYSDLDTTESIKTISIYTAVAKDDIDVAKKLIEKCIEDILHEKLLMDKDIELMKKVIKTGVASMLEDTSTLANYVLHQQLEGKSIHGFEEDMRLLNSITLKEIFEVANKIFKNPTIHILKSRK